MVHDKNQIISMGYNGYPPNVEDTLSDPRDVKYKKTIHAEHNALKFSNNRRVVKGCTAFVTHHPCKVCMERLGKRGVARVVYLTGHGDFDVRWADRLRESAEVARRYNIQLIPVDLESLTS